MPGLTRRGLLKGVAAVGVLGVVGLGANELSYRVRQAGWQRAERTRLVLRGRVVTFDPTLGVVDDGLVLVDQHGAIAAVGPAAASLPADYLNATRVETDGVIYPGLVDLHNHPYFDLRSLWTPARTTPYTSRYEWRSEPEVVENINGPDAPLGVYWRFATEEAMKFVELKAIAGGVTTIQGLGLDAPLREGWLIRHVERESRNGRPAARSFVFKPEVADPFALLRATIASGTAVIYHLAEGTDPQLGSEFEELYANGCIGPRFVGIHANALTAEQLQRWSARGGSLVWSPMSNLWLYGRTTDVAAARRAGLRLCLGPDWSISGSKNLLGELKVADLWNRGHLNGLLSDRELCEMATANPADALGLDDRIGRIRPGLRADLLVLPRRREDPYRNLIDATEAHVSLVIADGHARYGTSDLMRRAGALNVASVDAPSAHAVSLPEPDVASSVLSWGDVVSDLERVRSAQRISTAIPFLPRVPMPPLDTLAPDEPFFRTVEAAPIAGPLLFGLREYYV